MHLLIDPPSRDRLAFHRLARGRSYYLTEPPVLGILVIRIADTRLEDLIGLTVDANLGNEHGVEGWCVLGYAGCRHGKATVYRVVNDTHDTPLSAVLDTWQRRYPLR